MNPLMFQPWPCGPSVNFRTVLSWPRMLFMNSLPVLLQLQRPLLTSLCSLFQLSLIHPGGCLLHHEDRQSCLLCCGICSSACSALVYFSSACSSLVVFSSALVLLSSDCSTMVLFSSSCFTIVHFGSAYSALVVFSSISSACSVLVGISSTLASCSACSVLALCSFLALYFARSALAPCSASSASVPCYSPYSWTWPKTTTTPHPCSTSHLDFGLFLLKDCLDAPPWGGTGALSQSLVGVPMS